jgi:hypothetical protein
MYDILVVFVHLIVTVVRLMKPGGLRAIVAESVFTRHQILIRNRSWKQAPNLRVYDRLIAVYASFSCARFACCDVVLP